MEAIGFWNITEKPLFPLCVKLGLQPWIFSHWAYQCTSIFRSGSTLASEHDWLQSPPIPYPILPSPYFTLPFPLLLLCFWPCHQLVFQEEGGRDRKKKRRIASAQGQGPDGRRHSSSHFHSAPGPLRSQLHIGVQCVHPAKAQPLNDIHSSQLFQQKHPSDIIPRSYPHLSQAQWHKTNKLQTLAQCIITYKYHHPAN